MDGEWTGRKTTGEMLVRSGGSSDFILRMEKIHSPYKHAGPNLNLEVGKKSVEVFKVVILLIHLLIAINQVYLRET